MVTEDPSEAGDDVEMEVGEDEWEEEEGWGTFHKNQSLGWKEREYLGRVRGKGKAKGEAKEKIWALPDASCDDPLTKIKADSLKQLVV